MSKKNINDLSTDELVDVIVTAISEESKKIKYNEDLHVFPKYMNIKNSFEPNAKVIGKVTNARIDNHGRLVYDVEIFDKEAIEAIKGGETKQLSLSYKGVTGMNHSDVVKGKRK